MPGTVDSAIKELEFSGITFEKNVPMNLYTSFAIGGSAAVFVVPKNEQEVCAALRAAKKYDLEVFVLGKGSNVLFCDETYDGMVLHIADNFRDIWVEGDILTAGAGANLADVCVYAQQNALSGLEFAYGIPGSVGGAVCMNAGAYDGEIKNVLKSVTAVNGDFEIVEIPLSELGLEYRKSVFQDGLWCILAAKFCLQKDDKRAIRERMAHNMSLRQEKQPLEMPSAGSAFKRPEGAFAGELIDKCGLRGYRVGDAAISEKHCGFIVNLGKASCKDVLTLAQYVIDTVKKQTGFVLEKEIHVVGECGT